MDKIDQIIRLFVFICIGLFACYFLFKYPYAFNYELENNGQYLSVFISFSSLLLLLICRFVFNKGLEAKAIVLLAIINVIALILLKSEYYSSSNEYMANVTVCLILCSMLMCADEYLLHVIALLLILLFLYQLGLACQQMHWFSLKINRLNITGSLRNSGIFSCYLVLQMPFFYYSAFGHSKQIIGINSKREYKNIRLIFKLFKVFIFVLIFAFVAFIVFKSASRTAIIALVAVAFFIIYDQVFGTNGFFYKYPRMIKLLATCTFVLLVVCCVIYLFPLKKLSTSGRLLMFDIAMEHLQEHYIWGTGIGRFTWYYPQWQSQYFSVHRIVPDQYFLSAGESYVIMNEYLQLLETVGVTGIFVCLIILLWFFGAKSSKYYGLLMASKQTMILILLFGCTSYPFHVNIILLQMIICFAVVAIVTDRTGWLLKGQKLFEAIPKTYVRCFIAVCLVTSACAAYAGFWKWKAKSDWEDLRNDLSGSRSEIKKGYLLLKPVLKYDGKFLTDYGAFLVEDSSSCLEATSVLKEAKRYFISRETMEAMGIANRKIEKYKIAIDQYVWLGNYLPNRFGLKLSLLKLYMDVEDSLDALRVRDIILTMPVKIQSSEVERIKVEAEGVMK